MQVNDKEGEKESRKQAKEAAGLTVLSSKPPNYYSYILRCWVEKNVSQGRRSLAREEMLCRYSLEDPHTGERFTFAELEPLCDFLRARAECGISNEK